MTKTKIEAIGEAFRLPSGVKRTHADGVTTYHDVPLVRSGINIKTGKDGKKKAYFRTIGSLEKAARFNMRVISPDDSAHPPANNNAAFTTSDLAHPDYPVLGYTSNQHVKLSADKKTGILMGDINIDDVDAAGNSTAEIVTGLNDETLHGLSWGIVRHTKDEPGEFEGEAYDAVETLINPFHITIAKPQFQTVCPPDKCGPQAKGEAEDQHDSHGGDSMPGDEEEQTPLKGDGPKPPKEKGADAPASPQTTLVNDVVASRVSQEKAEREKNDMAAQLEDLKKKNKELEDGAEAGKKALETLSAQQKEEITGLRGELEKELGPDKIKEVYGDDGIPEMTPCDLKTQLKLATHGVPEPKGEAEDETAVNGSLNVVPKGEAAAKKKKAAEKKPTKLSEAVKYDEPVAPGRKA